MPPLLTVLWWPQKSAYIKNVWNGLWFFRPRSLIGSHIWVCVQGTVHPLQSLTLITLPCLSFGNNAPAILRNVFETAPPAFATPHSTHQLLGWFVVLISHLLHLPGHPPSPWRAIAHYGWQEWGKKTKAWGWFCEFHHFGSSGTGLRMFCNGTPLALNDWIGFTWCQILHLACIWLCDHCKTSLFWKIRFWTCSVLFVFFYY